MMIRAIIFTLIAQLPVVLFVGSGTGSSGEFLIMAFQGRANCILLGTETAGMVSVNNGFSNRDHRVC